MCGFEEEGDMSMMIKLRGMTAFQIKVGRWRGVEREYRVCKECQRLVKTWKTSATAPRLLETASGGRNQSAQWFSRTCHGVLRSRYAFVLFKECTHYAIIRHLSAMWCVRLCDLYEQHYEYSQDRC